MTAPAPQESNDKAAAVGFGVVLALMLGGVGVVIAALAVGAEKAWNGGREQGQRASQRRRSWLDQQRAWLDADHQARTARGRAYTEWLRSGADPATEPARPSWWRRTRDGARRGVANTVIGATDFREGFADGWRAANDTRRGGGSFRDVVATRPISDNADEKKNAVPAPTVAHAGECGGCGQRRGLNANGRCAECAGSPPINTKEEPVTQTDSGTQIRQAAANDRAAGHNGAASLGDTMAAAADRSAQRTSNGGSTMTQTASPQQHAESNATVLRGLLGGIQGTLGQVSDNTDALAALRNKLQQQVDRAEEHATSSGQSAQARQSLDEARQVVTLLGQHLGAFSEGTVSAEDQVGQASAGLRSAEEAEDSLRATGADGRAVAPATNA